MVRQAPADGEFRLRSVAVAAFAPATLFGLAEGAMLPVDRRLGVRARGEHVDGGVHRRADRHRLAADEHPRRNPRDTHRRAQERCSSRRWSRSPGCCCASLNLGRGAASLAVYGLGVLLIGAAGSVYSLARQSYLTEMVPLHMRARALSTLGGTMRIGLFIGPFLGAGATAAVGALRRLLREHRARSSSAGVIVHRVPDLELGEEHRQASAQVTTKRVLKEHWRVFLTLGHRCSAASGDPADTTERDPAVGAATSACRRPTARSSTARRRDRRTDLLSGRQGHGRSRAGGGSPCRVC